jgi:hypothetical protein
VRQHLSERVFLVVGPAAALALADLTVKSRVPTPPWDFHQRSSAWFALSVVVLVGALALALVPSIAVGLAAGVMSGGVIGNLVSARLDDNRVPNPFLIGSPRNGVAFNLADVFFLVGNLMLTAALVAVTVRHRDRLIPPRAWHRAFRRRLRL